MKLRLHLLVCTLLVLPAARTFLRAAPSGNEPCPRDKTCALVTGITGQWKVIENLPKGCPPEDEKDVRDLGFASCFAFVMDKNPNKNPKVVGPETGGSLVILINGQATSYHCDSAKDHPQCNRPDKDSQNCVCQIVASGQSSGSSWVAILALFTASPARYITPVSRGLEAELADGIAPLQGDHLDLAAAFHEMDPGTYRLRLESLSGSTKASIPVQLQWSGDGPASVSVPGVQPGLYRLARLGPNGEPVGSDAWILVSGPDRFAKDSAAFQSAVEDTKNWPDDVDARAPHAVLRAYLDSLSRQAQR